MAEVVWTEPALAQLEAIAAFIALDKPEAAARVVRRIFAVTEEVESFVRLGRAVPELRHAQYRQIRIPPCWIYDRVGRERIYVLHVRRAERPFRAGDIPPGWLGPEIG